MTDLLVDYWNAIQRMVPEAFEDPSEYVIQKTPGLFSLHLLLKDQPLPQMYQLHMDWDGQSLYEMIKDRPEISDSNSWHRSPNYAASYGSGKGFRELADLLIDSVTLGP